MGTNSSPAPKTPTGKSSTSGREPKRSGTRSGWWIWVIFVGLAGAAGYRYYPQVTQGASKSEKGPEKAPAKRVGQTVPVVAAVSRIGDLPIYFTGLGSVSAYNTVTIRSRVDGELINVAFSEGQLVRQGDLLAEIDPRPFEAQLTQAEGQLARDTAQLENARLDLKRYELLSSQGVIARQQLDTQNANVHQYEGTIQADQGMIANIKLQLVYSHIHAPLTGRIGLRLTDRGNIVHANDPSGLATITQLQPIAVLFNLAQDFLPQVMAKWRDGQTLPVEAWDRDLKKKLATGKLLTIDNTIDASTGTARFKAEFANADSSLFPNQFVNARLLVDTRRGVAIVPAAAVQRSPLSTFVYVVKDDQTVEMRNIVPGPVEGDNSSVESGLNSGEIVVIDGVDKLQQGARVEARVVGEPSRVKGGQKTGESSKAGEPARDR
ncbi:MAG: MdtA/MuxA family multidrug efflux RND transporter periplasmic adaptor subunit [Acidobacteriia bacterium]|nr:MdtA/MuxA family multidrug efflux RND transporter periplasmic adaptor subunit [Terriglobia bacterium]